MQGGTAGLVGKLFHRRRARVANFCKGLEVDVELGTQGAVDIVVAPLAPSRRTDLGGPVHQFVAKIDKLQDPAPEGWKLPLIAEIRDLLPIGDNAGEFAIAPDELIGI